jgi:hypothetical protein
MLDFLKKNFDWLLPVLLILFGGFLEVYYYFMRFSRADGVVEWVGILIGVGLTVLLMAVSWQKRTVLKVFLIVFSVIATSGGQSFSLIEKNKENVQAQSADELKLLEAEQASLVKEYAQIQERISTSIKSLEDQFEYKNTLATAETRKAEISQRQKEIQVEIKGLNKDQTNVEAANIYSFYADLFGEVVPVSWIKFILHTLLSIFIAIMAPTGISALLRAQNRETAEVPRVSEVPVVVAEAGVAEVAPASLPQVVSKSGVEVGNVVGLNQYIKRVWERQGVDADTTDEVMADEFGMSVAQVKKLRIKLMMMNWEEGPVAKYYASGCVLQYEPKVIEKIIKKLGE